MITNKKYLDFVWSIIVKAKAGFKSEISGSIQNLNSHHLRKKPNLRLRYSILNGVCCTENEHLYGFHNKLKCKSYEKKISNQRGKDLCDRLNKMKYKLCITNGEEIEKYLMYNANKHKKEILKYLENRHYTNKFKIKMSNQFRNKLELKEN